MLTCAAMRIAILTALVFVFACNDQKPQAQTRPAASPEPIPGDLVFNAFMDDKGGSKVAVATDAAAATDAGAQTGSTAKLIDAGADPKSPLSYTFANKTRTVSATIKMNASAAAGGEQPPF